MIDVHSLLDDKRSAIEGSRETRESPQEKQKPAVLSEGGLDALSTFLFYSCSLSLPICTTGIGLHAKPEFLREQWNAALVDHLITRRNGIQFGDNPCAYGVRIAGKTIQLSEVWRVDTADFRYYGFFCGFLIRFEYLESACEQCA
jgi:hypothetical protein